MGPNQTAFRRALLDPHTPVPEGLVDRAGAPAGRRFSVYRNNVAVSLTEALQTGFPVLEKLLGPGNFAQLAGLYLRAHPPKSPLMMYFGEDLPAYLEAFEPLKHIGYLPDIARLELGLRKSYHAADSRPLPAQDLAALTDQSVLRLAPAAIYLASPWPLWDIWQFNTQENAPKPRAIAQHVLITRAEFDPTPHALNPAEGAFVAALKDHMPLGDALAKAAATEPDFDMTPVLTLLVQGNALIQSQDRRSPEDDQ